MYSPGIKQVLPADKSNMADLLRIGRLPDRKKCEKDYGLKDLYKAEKQGRQ